MKSAGLTVALVAFAAGNHVASAARFRETPMAKVVTLLENMKTKIEADAKSEQKAYDEYKTWCEDTLKEKAKAITDAEDKVEELSNNIVKNKGGLGSGGATIAQLKKDIGENIESVKEATEVRKKENTAYDEEKLSAEQCIGALEAAIKVLTGAGSKKGFLETLQEAQLLSVVGSMRTVLKAPEAKHSVSNTDLEVVKHFVEKPEDFVKGSSVSAVQMSQNPFGDYAPQSTQIQGILKSMYDSFTGDLEKDNAEEGEKQKSFEELMATKKKELKTLQGSLEDETKSEAERTKSVADDKAMRDDTQAQLDADKDFFASTKLSCSEKARAWDSRSKLREKELAGISKAIEILNSDEAKKTFTESTKFLQLTSVVHKKGDGSPRAEAYKRLRSLASRYNSLELAQIAIAVKTKGHFDDVMVMIDKMIALLREEEQEDISHRDRCEGKQNANVNDKEDAEHQLDKFKALIERLEQAQKDKEAEIKEIKESMKKTEKTMDDIKKQREKETEAFKKAVKADNDALKLLEEARRSLKKFYREAGLMQEPEGAPVALAAAKPEPETAWMEGGDYKGEAGSGRGVVGIIDMLIEDLEKEIKTEGQDEIDAQTDYEKERSALTKTYRAAEKSLTGAEVELSEIKSDKSDATDSKDAAQKDVDDEEKLAKAIEKDCSWVKTHFEKRRKARKAEIDGLMDAKDFLAGVGTDSDLSMP